MSKQLYPFIRPGKFTTNFEVVFLDGAVIPCYNLATARSIKQHYIRTGEK